MGPLHTPKTDGTRSASTQEPPPTKPPVVVQKAEPVYPDSAKRAGVQGTVIVWVTVDETGEVVRAWVGRSDLLLLNDAAVEAAYRYRFTPAKIRGRDPVQSTTAVRIEFSLED